MNACVMDPLTIAAAGGLRARMESLDMLANNIANAATQGYKTDREFYSLYVSGDAANAGPQNPDPDTLPVIERPWTDFSQGMLKVTDNPVDFALSGRGFFAVNSPSGPLYTRNGSFQISSTGLLSGQDGYPVRATGGGTLTLRPNVAFEVSSTGEVIQAGQGIGRIDVVDFAKPEVLTKQGANYYRNSDPKLVPGAATATEVHQGKLENSNVPMAEGAIRLVSTMRQFEMLQKAVGLGAEMNRRAVEEVAKVNQ
jgi:flagellar basal body rod protein FlgG